jgi:hypothetical protein
VSDLGEFLLQRFAEDMERVNRIHHDLCATVDGPEAGSAPVVCDCGTPLKLTADIKAKRRIVFEYEVARDKYSALPFADAGELAGLVAALRCLALAYSAHPNYKALRVERTA